uniref:Uncharacterized protein n=1 Tax=Chaetoceros debilis TaxID=122233 RepID=A0A7S3QAR8_9STRA
MIMMLMSMLMLTLPLSSSWLIALLTFETGEHNFNSVFVDGYVPVSMSMPMWKSNQNRNTRSSHLKLFPFTLLDDRLKGRLDKSIWMASLASSEDMDMDMDMNMDKSTGKSMAMQSEAIDDSSKGRIETVHEEGASTDHDHEHEHDSRTWTQRLAAYLISERTEIVHEKKIAIVIGSCLPLHVNASASVSVSVSATSKSTPPSPHPLSWIGSLVGQLGASSVHLILSPEEEEALTLTLQNNKDKEPLISHEYEYENDLNLQVLQNCKVPIDIRDSAEFDDIGDGDDNIDIIILSTTSPNVVNEDPFINDFLRRTDTPIYMSADLVDEFCYHARIQEGANITLW